LEISTAHISFEEVAQAFSKVTGKKAVCRHVPLQDWVAAMAPEDKSMASDVDIHEPGAMSWRKNFSGLYTALPKIKRDYDLLDKVSKRNVDLYWRFCGNTVAADRDQQLQYYHRISNTNI
jgi:hypothetical protein